MDAFAIFDVIPASKGEIFRLWSREVTFQWISCTQEIFLLWNSIILFLLEIYLLFQNVCFQLFGLRSYLAILKGISDVLLRFQISFVLMETLVMVYRNRLYNFLEACSLFQNVCFKAILRDVMGEENFYFSLFSS